jgi:hypothetical protein
MVATVQFPFRTIILTVVILASLFNSANAADTNGSNEEVRCRALLRLPNLTILSAEIVQAKGGMPPYCYVTGLISPGIHWHAQLPLPSSWNGRLVNVGNGGKAGTLIFSPQRVAPGVCGGQ